MIGITPLKERLSHINEASWHYQAVKSMWPRKVTHNPKSCKYWWWYVPSALLIMGFIYAFGGIIWLFSGFAGFRMKFEDNPGPQGSDMFYPYKENKKGRKVLIAPWEVAVVLLVLFVLYSMVQSPAIALWGLNAVGILAVLVAVLFILFRGWKSQISRDIRMIIAAWWDKACPALIVYSSQEDRD